MGEGLRTPALEQSEAGGLLSNTASEVCVKKRLIHINFLVQTQRIHQLEVWVLQSEQFQPRSEGG